MTVFTRIGIGMALTGAVAFGAPASAFAATDTITDYGIYALTAAPDSPDGWFTPGYGATFSYSTFPAENAENPMVMRLGEQLVRTITVPNGLELDGQFAGAAACPIIGSHQEYTVQDCIIRDNGDGTRSYVVTQTFKENYNLLGSLHASGRLAQTGEIPDGAVLRIEQTLAPGYVSQPGAQTTQTIPLPVASSLGPGVDAGTDGGTIGANAVTGDGQQPHAAASITDTLAETGVEGTIFAGLAALITAIGVALTVRSSRSSLTPNKARVDRPVVAR